MTKNAIQIILWILVIQVISFGFGYITNSQIPVWYLNLNKPFLTPPSITFPIVWTLLYIMISLSGWWLWKNRQAPRAKKAFQFFMLQLTMNWLWTPIFFYWHLIGFAFLWILALIAITSYVIYLSVPNYRFSGYMLLPYLLWLCFAAYLNGAIWYLN